MKGLNLFLAACLTVSMMDGAVADTQKTGTRNTGTRGQTVTQTRGQQTTKRTNNTQSRTTTNQKNIIQRTNATINAVTEKNRSALPTRDIVSRTAKRQNILARPQSKSTTARAATISGTRTLSRAATNTTTKTRESVMQRDFTKCKSVFFDCMDEFCANKDAQLKRCACSARANEFRNTQKSLDNVEDKLLDFSQRLLQINMDPDDAAVINVESEGEKAYFDTKDKTASRKTLDEIAKKLNTTFDSAESNNMSALSWSLDVDSAFDSVDSLSGTTATAKSGTALRNVALPICRDMAAEVCEPEDISLVENSYNMAIEQDCNTVKRAYNTQTAAARTKILESGALLDMTRLNNYQDRNSDDILTCKAKMLDMLTDTNVCGTNLTKCLDISGRYINPTTGEAFLSPELINLANLLVRPTDGDTWSKTPKNSSFVSFLNTKKKYLEPATKNCEDIADDVWDGFIDDALAQIKIAQGEKLEEVRQSCTKLLADCLDNAKTDLSEFDSRALSTFGVMTDKTANALCENVKTSCANIMKYASDGALLIPDNDTTDATNNINWDKGVTEIAARETYNTIINTCREVGRDCIINSCKSITGNFGLCESINNSVNRHSILTRSACWKEVYDCVASASDTSIQNIHEILPNHGVVPAALYNLTYNGDSTVTSTVWDICREGEQKCHAMDSTNDTDREELDCYKCRIAEQIWGNCEHKPDNQQTNAILIPKDANTTTLLSWFAKNTHTQGNLNSCATSICPAGKIDMLVDNQTVCKDPAAVVQCISGTSILCETPFLIPTGASIQNCCPSGKFDAWGNCCENGVSTRIYDHLGGLLDSSFMTGTTPVCTPNITTTSIRLVAKYTTTATVNYDTYIFCAGNISANASDPNELDCDGQFYSLVCYDGTNDCQYYIGYSGTGTPDLNGISATNENYAINSIINIDKNSPDYCPVNVSGADVYNEHYKLQDTATGLTWMCDPASVICTQTSGITFNPTASGSIDVKF